MAIIAPLRNACPEAVASTTASESGRKPDGTAAPAAQPASLGVDHIALTPASRPLLTAALIAHAVPANNAVASMSLGEKVATSASSGIMRAGKDTAGALGTFLRDPKNDALLVGGTGALLAVQAVPGLDVGVDATLGIVGAAMYASAGPEHRENITKALGKLKDYAGEVGSAKSQASTDFAHFLKLGGKEAVDGLTTLAGAAAAPTKLFGLASKINEIGGIDGIIAAGSKGLSAASDVLKSAGGGIHGGLDAAGHFVDDLAAQVGHGFGLELAIDGAPLAFAAPKRAGNVLESRAAGTGGIRRNLDAQEASGGHTIARHVGKSDNWLKNRLADDRKIPAASTFTNEAAANRAQGIFVKKNREAIRQWLDNPNPKKPTFEMTMDIGEPIGRVLTRGESKSTTTTTAELCFCVTTRRRAGIS